VEVVVREYPVVAPVVGFPVVLGVPVVAEVTS
jgi:hypothetical protein